MRKRMEEMPHNLRFRRFAGLGIDDLVGVKAPANLSGGQISALNARSAGQKACGFRPGNRDRLMTTVMSRKVMVFPTTALMENRSGLILQGDLTRAYGHAERRAALDMVHRHSPGATRRRTLGADKGFVCEDVIADLRQACVPPHVARKARHSAIDGRTTRHEGYALSLKHRKRIEAAFGWAKTIDGMAQTADRGIDRVRQRCILTMAANNLARSLGCCLNKVESRQPTRPCARTANSEQRTANSEQRTENQGRLTAKRKTVPPSSLFQRPVKAGCR